MTGDEAGRSRLGYAPGGIALPGSGDDPLVATIRRARDFLRAGWRFEARLAERMPQLFLAGWSL
ncbi:hypothetical protein [Nocardia sp. NBC_00416]|uniref:hypothetical protein n=1 Tax=Nocardia sp. NBC_00416 TaxID=2975991 RepID=UPI002E20A889